MARTTETDRAAVSQWLKYYASPEEKKAIQKEFKIADRTMQQYSRVGKSGRDIIPKRVLDRDLNRLNAKDQRLVETLRAMTSEGLRLSPYNRTGVEQELKRFKSLTSAANELNRLQQPGRLKVDKVTGNNIITVKGEKIIVDGLKIRRNPDGSYSVVVVRPPTKGEEEDEDDQGNPWARSRKRKTRKEVEEEINQLKFQWEEQEKEFRQSGAFDESRYAPGTDF